jgi:serine/threonine protein kinase
VDSSTFAAKSRLTEEEVQLSVEPTHHSRLEHQTQVYRLLSGGIRMPAVRAFATHGTQRYLVTPLAGPSLEDLLQFCGGQLSMKTVLNLADQLLSRIEFLHSREILHRDISPISFVVGLKKLSNTISFARFDKAITFGIAEAAIPSQPHTVSSTVFGSLRSDDGAPLSRRDDLESLGYLLLYLCYGSLAWQHQTSQLRQMKRDFHAGEVPVMEHTRMEKSVIHVCLFYVPGAPGFPSIQLW